MADRAFVERLRTQGGPSLELLVLLDTHRVLTTDQLARAGDTPVRTVRYRLDRLREHGLVDAVRPGRESGSLPRHWWLSPAGARLVAGVAPATPRRPSAMFAPHTAAIAEVWLALREHGPAAGVHLQDWRADRAGWQEWEPSGLGSRLRRLTPDAVLTARLDDVDGPAVAFVEVDLGTMTQTQLRDKLDRYLAYAGDRAWQGVHPHCPPMLLLTTTAARSVNYIRAARRTLAAADRGRRGGYRAWAGAEVEADALVVAACGLVRDPGRAVAEPVWLLPDEAAAELTLAELLAERVTTQAAAVAWRAEQAAAEAAQQRADALDDAGRRSVDELTRLLAGDATAAGVLHHLLDDPARLDPGLAEQIVTWWGTRRSKRRPDGPAPQQLVDELRGRHPQLWAAHARAVLAARALIDAEDPALAVAAATVQDGRLLTRWDLDRLAAVPEQDRAQRQAAALGDYVTRRRRDVERQLQALGWLARRRTDPAELAARYDAEQLLLCDLCAMATPRSVPEQGVYEGAPGEVCRHCHTGHLVEAGQAAAVPSLADRLAALRHLLRTGAADS